ncbi:MAG: hypothetical protein KGL39_52545 [Patescibacteria group bacterium]|nr:hypothetical protein [Patescibacteria group bacterium]
MPSVLFNGEPGTAWTNTGTKVRYQFFCDWVHTCGTCAQYDHAIGAIWPIPLHHRCRCHQSPILVGATADPFINFRAKIDSLDPANQAKVIGKSAYQLVKKGVIKWEDVVTSTHVRTLQEVVAREKLTIGRMLKSGIRQTIAEKAYAAVHTPAEAILKAHRAKLIANLEGAGLTRQQIIDVAAKKIAERVTIQGPSGTQTVKFGVGDLGALLERIAATNAALNAPKGIAAKPVQTPKPPTPKPYTIEVIGDIPTEKIAEFEQWVSELPPEVHAEIDKSGGKFVFAERADKLPATQNAPKPRGWPADAEWKNVRGYYDPKTKQVVVAHEHVDYFTKELKVTERLKGVLYHEAGHGLDAAIGGSSTAPRFAKAYAADVAAMSTDTKEAMSYFLQPGSAGPNETFAEVFANVLGQNTDQVIADKFPEFAKTMGELFDALKRRNNIK